MNNRFKRYKEINASYEDMGELINEWLEDENPKDYKILHYEVVESDSSDPNRYVLIEYEQFAGVRLHERLLLKEQEVGGI